MPSALGKRWCGFLRCNGGAHCAPLLGQGVRIATPVYALARNDRIIAFSMNIKLVYNASSFSRPKNVVSSGAAKVFESYRWI